eukprot:TRINITY_DN6344_c0_g2_i1.p1 TRINITY_DN6344_c0_g2~~TRINITY_DN6344_c0_g2_i1.p1  ORF type:complete len:227 (+),score=34.57 TRINITY_DN6344_c0_g2_i1:49-681(+)
MDIIQRKIAAIAAVNEEIISRMEEYKKTSVITNYTYKVEHTQEGYKLTTTPVTTPGLTIITSWTPPVSCVLQPIKDTFNDKIDVRISNYQSVAQLSSRLAEVAIKYDLFGDNPRPSIFEILEVIKKNLEVLQVALGDLETHFIPVENKEEQHIVALDNVNKAMKAAQDAYTSFKQSDSGIIMPAGAPGHLMPTPPVPTPTPSLYGYPRYR